jgi:Lipid A 3-O-deacylase (PagL)
VDRGLFFCLALAASCGCATAQGFSLESAGARVGGSPTPAGHKFHQAEAFLNFNLPYSWQLGRRWELKSRLDFSAGWLGDPGGNASITTLSPTLVVGREHFPLSVGAGAGATLLSADDFQEKDFGDVVQFTSYIGLDLDLPAHLRLGYRFQHMSNGGISGRNPGLNLHMLALSYRF